MAVHFSLLFHQCPLIFSRSRRSFLDGLPRYLAGCSSLTCLARRMSSCTSSGIVSVRSSRYNSRASRAAMLFNTMSITVSSRYRVSSPHGEAIADLQHLGSLRAGAVNLDPALITGICSQRPGLEDAGYLKPFIQSNRFLSDHIHNKPGIMDTWSPGVRENGYMGLMLRNSHEEHPTYSQFPHFSIFPILQFSAHARACGPQPSPPAPAHQEER